MRGKGEADSLRGGFLSQKRGSSPIISIKTVARRSFCLTLLEPTTEEAPSRCEEKAESRQPPRRVFATKTRFKSDHLHQDRLVTVFFIYSLEPTTEEAPSKCEEKAESRQPPRRVLPQNEVQVRSSPSKLIDII